MKATIICLLLFPSFLFTINVQKTEAAPYQNPETGLVFEETMGGLTKGNVRNFEEKYPGLGVSIGYNAPGITATVYIYNLGLKTIDGNPDAPVFKNHFKEAIQEIFAAEKAGHYSNVKLLGVRTIPFGKEKTCPTSLAASLSYTQGDRLRLSRLYLLVYQQHFLKIRVTYDENAKAQAEKILGAFCYQVGKLMGCE